MDQANRNFDEIITNDSYLVFENKTTPFAKPQKLRPRFGHVAALLMLLVSMCLLPLSIQNVLSAATVIGMGAVAWVFLIHLPIKTIINDRRVVSDMGSNSASNKPNIDTRASRTLRPHRSSDNVPE